MLTRGDVHFSVQDLDAPEIEIVGTAEGFRKLARLIDGLAEDMTSSRPDADVGEHFHWFGTLGGESNDSLNANFRKIDRPSTGLPDPEYLDSLSSANADLRAALNSRSDTG